MDHIVISFPQIRFPDEGVNVIFRIFFAHCVKFIFLTHQFHCNISAVFRDRHNSPLLHFSRGDNLNGYILKFPDKIPSDIHPHLDAAAVKSAIRIRLDQFCGRHKCGNMVIQRHRLHLNVADGLQECFRSGHFHLIAVQDFRTVKEISRRQFTRQIDPDTPTVFSGHFIRFHQQIFRHDLLKMHRIFLWSDTCDLDQSGFRMMTDHILHIQFHMFILIFPVRNGFPDLKILHLQIGKDIAGSAQCQSNLLGIELLPFIAVFQHKFRFDIVKVQIRFHALAFIGIHRSRHKRS